MKQIHIDCTKMTDRAAAHDCLACALSLPEYYGRNLDALYDCLTEMAGTAVTLENVSSLDALGVYGDALLQTFRDAARDVPDFELTEK